MSAKRKNGGVVAHQRKSSGLRRIQAVNKQAYQTAAPGSRNSGGEMRILRRRGALGASSRRRRYLLKRGLSAGIFQHFTYNKSVEGVGGDVGAATARAESAIIVAAIGSGISNVAHRQAYRISARWAQVIVSSSPITHHSPSIAQQEKKHRSTHRQRGGVTGMVRPDTRYL